MKGYTKPDKIVQGICFLCGKECYPFAYCHTECAIAYTDAKDKLIEDAKIKSREIKDD